MQAPHLRPMMNGSNLIYSLSGEIWRQGYKFKKFNLTPFKEPYLYFHLEEAHVERDNSSQN